MSCNMILEHDPYGMSNSLTVITHFDQRKDYFFDKIWMQREEEVKNIVLLSLCLTQYPAYILPPGDI